MANKIVRAMASNGEVRIIAGITTELVNEGVKIHNCAPTAAAAFGRLLTSASLMGATMKNEKDTLTLKIDGGGDAKGIVATAYANGNVKGYIGNPNVDLPANEKGKLDVGGAVGKNGNLVVIRDLGLKEPYVGQVPIYTGEIGDDVAYYYTVSEQTPSAVGVGVLVDKDLSVKAAGGFIIQMMPGANELLADTIMYRLQEVPPITTMISDGKSIEEILREIFDGMELQILQDMHPEYSCDCSREKVEKALISIGKEEINNIIEENKEEEIKCHFCGERYVFTPQDLKKLVEEI